MYTNAIDILNQVKKYTGWFRLENTGNLRNMEAVFRAGFLRIFPVTSCSFPLDKPPPQLSNVQQAYMN